LKRQIVVIGMGRLGASIARTLYSIGHEVLALDQDEKNIQDVASQVTQAVQVDPTNESALKELGIGNFDIGIVALPEIETNVLATILLKKLGVRYIIARAISEPHGSILQRIGANKVVYPEQEMGTGIAYVLTLGDVIDYIPVTSEYGVVKLSAPAQFVGKTLPQLGFGHYGKWEVIVLLIQRKQDIIINPGNTEGIKAEDVLIVAGSFDKLEKLFSHVQEVTISK
jgi:trk system potassium uptake protein TrkA